MLGQHEPFPAVVMDRGWNLVRTNDGAQRLFGRMFAPQPAPEAGNVLRLILEPGPVRSHIANWEEVAPALLERARREAVGGVLDLATAELVQELRTVRTWALTTRQGRSRHPVRSSTCTSGSTERISGSSRWSRPSERRSMSPPRSSESKRSSPPTTTRLAAGERSAALTPRDPGIRPGGSAPPTRGRRRRPGRHTTRERRRPRSRPAGRGTGCGRRRPWP